MQSDDPKYAKSILAKKQRQYDIKTGKRLKKLRVAAGLKAYWVAEKLGIGANQLSEMEAGKRHWNEEIVAKYEACIKS